MDSCSMILFIRVYLFCLLYCINLRFLFVDSFYSCKLILCVSLYGFLLNDSCLLILVCFVWILVY
ncbi:hypothetical protein T492DRAFT_994288 [Pavlovales sp. CCMP2436]|nr:hypothetical protein T492DRAFT_994288 [Pavlovales sp. CCMP2436]